ncbi:hypothetical protein F5Y19DRAFT_260467 [Xylariaceae sp. FL1651]|nr:hypothetical protein F5Y19DRAFT_260467 [Xylariaceae sp. FL1651]
MVLLVCWSQELPRIPFDSITSETLCRPASVFQAHGLIVDHTTVIQYCNVDPNAVDFETTWQNIQTSARGLAVYAQHNQVDTPRLFGEFFAAFFNQRSALELLFIEYHIARASGAVHNTPLSMMARMAVWIGDAPDNPASMLARMSVCFGHRHNIPLFVPKWASAVMYVAELVIDIFWNSFMSGWMQEMLARSATQAPPHQCSRAWDQYLDQIHSRLD